MIEAVAIITGASKGIGRSISLGLAKLNYKTLLFARNETELIGLCDEIKVKYPNTPEPKYYVCNLLDSEKTSEILQSVIQEYSQIDILVNNAGIYQKGSYDNSLDDYTKMLGVNLLAPFIFLKAIIPLMKEKGAGYIFNIASRAGKIGFANSGFYSSSKFGLVGLSESLYRELSLYNIKVTALCPSFVNTSMAIDAGAPVSPNEMIQSEDLANSIEFLLKLSKEAYVRELMIDCRQTIL